MRFVRCVPFDLRVGGRDLFRLGHRPGVSYRRRAKPRALPFDPALRILIGRRGGVAGFFNTSAIPGVSGPMKNSSGLSPTRAIPIAGWTRYPLPSSPLNERPVIRSNAAAVPNRPQRAPAC